MALDLAAVEAAVYERGGYADLIDYSRPPPPPPFDAPGGEWLDALLAEKRLR